MKKAEELKGKIPEELFRIISSEIEEFRPSQTKAIDAGLLEGKNLLVCTPTASGKTLIAEIALMSAILGGKGKGIYAVPLKALASEKYKDFTKKYGHLAKIKLLTSDLDSSWAPDCDLCICTNEKLDSLLRRRNQSWIGSIKTVVIDEIHLLNELSRGPVIEIVITILKKKLKRLQLIGLSATIGNPGELAHWLEAELILDEWRPVKLHQGIYLDGEIDFKK